MKRLRVYSCHWQGTAITTVQSLAASNDISVTDKGVAIFSIRSVARMAGVSDMAIRKSLKSANHSPSKMAEMLIEQGIQAANLDRYGLTGIPDTAVSHVLFYYAAEAGRYCTVEAQNWVKAYMAIGLRAYVQKALGYASFV